MECLFARTKYEQGLDGAPSWLAGFVLPNVGLMTKSSKIAEAVATKIKLAQAFSGSDEKQRADCLSLIYSGRTETYNRCR